MSLADRSLNDFPEDQRPLTAYHALNQYFREHEDEVIEISILSDGSPPGDAILKRDGLDLGVPKNTLVAAFREARKRFEITTAGKDPSVPEPVPISHNDVTSPLTNSILNCSQKDALEATRIILLCCPEHLTAANYRKRSLLRQKHSVDDTYYADKHDAYLVNLTRELNFLNSLLTSPLYRHSKSPTLWHHRFWLQICLNPEPMYNRPSWKDTSFIEGEFKVIFQAAERHPANYYAWTYARKLLAKLDERTVSQNQRKYKDDFFRKFTKEMHHWCVKHPSDISGWEFYSDLVNHIEPLVMGTNHIDEVVKTVVGLYSDRQAVWIFLRRLLAEDCLEKSYRRKHLIRLDEYRQRMERADDSNPSKINVKQAMEWIQKYGQSVPNLDDPKGASTSEVDLYADKNQSRHFC